jgi:hypothetical protein
LAVDQLVQTLQLPLWKPERKPLTTWFVVDDVGRRTIMPIELEYAWEGMAAVAEERGLPLIRPQPDAEGQYGVDEQLLWGGYTEELAAQGATDVLIIAARREGNEWNARMNLEYAGQSWSWRNRDTAVELALAEGMHTTVTNIAAGNSISAADQGSWSVAVTVAGAAIAPAAWPRNPVPAAPVPFIVSTPSAMVAVQPRCFQASNAASLLFDTAPQGGGQLTTLTTTCSTPFVPGPHPPLEDFSP